MTNRYLSYYQIIGIIVSMTIISIWAFKVGGMMPFYILFAGLLFSPFIIVSTLSLLDLEAYKKTIKGGIWTGTVLLLALSYSLPFFFEWGGVILALICTGIGFYIWTKRTEIEWQISIFNVIGTSIVTVILISIIAAGLS
ncbi:hypothetical protein [Croceimicrobium hydrocarbonivorans]|uniref:Uncharacterized protein n=1 Tax=Croceimicrobium hydrocarbonivorans TaxID=2761580 RepID=A0A7H0VHD1_9FLAO|nr:hypothetical protein [Croceimicrobium hydrocarbonivorans]QNR25129.1 hypothetical protein H4K34_04635 [Croceimicrobium hydrocarbonivorans]